MDQTAETATENGIDFRARSGVLMEFAQTWVARHGVSGGFSVSKFADRIKNCVTVKMKNGVAFERQTSDGVPVSIVDLSDILSGVAYYAVLKKDSDTSELLTIIDESELGQVVGAIEELPQSVEQGVAELPEYIDAPTEQKTPIDETQTVLLRYNKENGDGNAYTVEVKRGELQTMIIKLLAEGVALETIEVWSQCRRPQINVEL